MSLTGLNIRPLLPESPPLRSREDIETEREILEEVQTEIITLQVSLDVHHPIFDDLFSEQEMAGWEKDSAIDFLDAMNRAIEAKLKELRQL